MSNTTFGLTMLLVGMGGTLATLLILSLVIYGLTLVFPVKPEASGEDKK